MKLRHDKHTRAVVMGLLALSMTAISTAARAGGDPWEPRGLEAVWSAGHRSHPEFMNVRRMEYERSQPASRNRADSDPWIPKGLEAVWSAGHRSHPEFMYVRRKEYEIQKGAALSTGNINEIVNLYDQGQRDQTPAEILVTGYQK